MSADRLRAAAAVLRERAEAATTGPWELVEPLPPTKYTTYEGAVRSTAMADGFDDTIGKTLDHADAAYIATMSPPVALALADWLDVDAERWLSTFEATQRPSPGVDEPPAIHFGNPDAAERSANFGYRHSIAVADAILGTP